MVERFIRIHIWFSGTENKVDQAWRQKIGFEFTYPGGLVADLKASGHPRCDGSSLVTQCYLGRWVGSQVLGRWQHISDFYSYDKNCVWLIAFQALLWANLKIYLSTCHYEHFLAILNHLISYNWVLMAFVKESIHPSYKCSVYILI